MPYFRDDDIDEDEDSDEVDEDSRPFEYVEPWQVEGTVLAFPDTPGPQPEVPDMPPWSPEPQWQEQYQRHRDGVVAQARWRISEGTGRWRDRGVKRVFGSYDGGNDESFTSFRGVEMSDGRRVTADGRDPEAAWGSDGEALVEDAVTALMGSYGTGPYTLRGIVIIDFDACTITDETRVEVVFGHKLPWEN